jgi:hypothetical protein
MPHKTLLLHIIQWFWKKSKQYANPPLLQTKKLPDSSLGSFYEQYRKKIIFELEKLSFHFPSDKSWDF